MRQNLPPRRDAAPRLQFQRIHEDRLRRPRGSWPENVLCLTTTASRPGRGVNPMPKQRPTACRESGRVIYEPVLPGQHLASRRERNISRAVLQRSLPHAGRPRCSNTCGADFARRRNDLAAARQRYSIARRADAQRRIGALDCAKVPAPSVLAPVCAGLILGASAISARGQRAMTAKMVAVGYAESLPITASAVSFEFETAVPQPGDSRPAGARAGGVRQSRRRQVAHAQAGDRAAPVILGWDAAGIVEAVGRELQPVQAGRPRLLRRQHQPARHRRALPPGRRAHRRPQAQVARLRRRPRRCR